MIDYKNLKNMVGDDKRLYIQLLKEFIDTTDQDMQQLEAAISIKNITEVQQLAHRIRGSALLLSITPLIDTANVIENSTENLLATTLSERFQQIKDAFEKAKMSINHHIKANSI